jgi:2'-5' RNA ligase
MPDSYRLFYAVWPDPATARHLHDATRQLHATCGGKLTRRETVHLTLVFLGNVAAAHLPELLEVGEQSVVEGFTLPISRYGWWKHNGIVWAAPEATPPALTRLVANLEQGLVARGIGFDRRPRYVPHITLVRKAQRAPVLAEPVATFDWKVSGFALMRSVLSAGGSAYEPVGTWALA